MSEKPTVVEALCAVMRDVQGVSKAQRNTQQNYRFRGVDDVVNAVGPVLREHGVLVLPVLEKASLRDVQTSTGKPARESVVEVRYRFYGPAGDSIDAVVPGESMDHGDKGIAKAMSVAYRIVLLQALCIPTGDPDPDSQTYERDEPRKASPRAAALFNAVMDAPDEALLKAAWSSVQGAYASDEITDDEMEQIYAHVTKRKAELAPPAAESVKSGGITKATNAKMFALFAAIGIKGDEAQHQYADQTLKRTGVSFKALSEVDAQILVGALEGRKRAMGATK